MTGRAGVDEHAAEKVRAEDERVAKVRRVINTVPCEWTYRPVANVALDSLAAELVSLKDALERADDMLRRLAEWDMLSVDHRGIAATADGPYWQSEIKRVRAAAREALGRQE